MGSIRNTQMFDVIDQDDSLSHIIEDNHQISVEILRDRHEVLVVLTTITELSTLHTCIAEEGLTPSLLKFVNHDNKLSRKVSGIPSLESSGSYYTDVDRDMALEGIGNTIADLVKKVVVKIKSFISKIVSSIKLRIKSLDELHKKIEQYTSMVNGKEFDTNNTIQTKLIKYEQLIELLDIALLTTPLSFEIIKLDLPTTWEKYNDWVVALNNLVYSKIDQYSVVRKGRIVSPKAIKSSLSGMGYGELSFGEIVSKLKEYINVELTDGPRLTQEIEERWNVTCDSIENMSMDVYVPGQGHSTYQSHAASMLGNAFDKEQEFIYSLSNDGWVHGVRQAIDTLGYLTKAYE